MIERASGRPVRPGPRRIFPILAAAALLICAVVFTLTAIEFVRSFQ